LLTLLKRSLTSSTFLPAVALLLVGIHLLITAPQVWGQADTSSISGTITDTSGAVISNARVTVRNEATGNERIIVTNATGAYTITNLASGTYSIRVEASGFQTAVQSATHLDPNIGSRVDLALKPGSAGTTVNVEADANTVQTETASVGQLVTAEQVKSLQLNGRNPFYLSQLEPGVMRNAAISSFSFSLDNTVYINGSRSEENLMTLDGAPMVRTRSNNDSTGVADVDSTSQVQILTTSYPAEYGRTSGGQIRIVPKSGTSTFHGTAYEYLRNSVFNANTWVRNSSSDPTIADHPPAFRYNQFGFNLNGPVYIPHMFNQSKQKLFFLIGQEYVRYRHDDTVTAKVPTALMRQGNFSELLGNNIFYSTPVQIVNPATKTPYQGNVITPSQLSPSGIGLLNAYPQPNVSNNSYNWIDAAGYPENQRKDTIVVDYVPQEAHHIRFSLLNFNYNSVNPHYGNFNRTPEVWNRPNQVAVLHYTWTINPTTVNEVMAGASADHVTIKYDLSSGLYDRTRYGISYPYLYSAATKELPNKIPTIEIANFETLDGGPYPSHSGGVVYDFGDNLTKVIGAHTLKFGVLWERSGENDFDQISVSSTTPGATNNQNGLFAFTDTRSNHPTSNAAVANTALGLFDTYGEIGQRSYTIFRGQMWEGFAQDQWRATPKLMLEFGARYSVMLPYSALWGNQSVFDPRSYSLSSAPAVDPTTGYTSGGDPYDGVVIPGSHFPSSAQGHVDPSIINGQYNRLFRGYGSGYSQTDWTDIQPRVGFAYAMRPSTVLRGGAGRYIQRLGISDQVHLGGNAPFQPSATVTAGSIDNPGGGGTNSLPLSFTSQPYKFPNPEAWGWNVTLEQEIPSFATFTMSYVGRRGLHLQYLANINQLQPGTVQANPTVTAPDALRPYRGFSEILQITNGGSSTYHAMQLNLKRRLTKGFLFGVAYTWSKSLDFGSDQSTELPNYYDLHSYYGRSDFDVRNMLVVNYVWDIPFANRASNRLMRSTLGNWQLSGTTQAQTGEPVSVSTGDDFAGVGPGAGNQLWVMSKTPNVSKGFSPNGTTGNFWFDPTVFHQPSAGTFAPRGTRNVISGPGFQSWNISLQKAIHIIPDHENHTVNFKAEAFNFTNHPNLDTPDSTPTSGTFGKVTQKGSTYASDRQLQFSLRYQF
jgi:Carboxypeptidase regulatory-like domain/TonB-dependent Receptor Plug Domain